MFASVYPATDQKDVEKQIRRGIPIILTNHAGESEGDALVVKERR